jgi:hypothetical protein
MSTKQRHSPRPWYCSDTLVEAYKSLESTQGNLKMLQYLKIFRGLVLNLLVGGFGTFAITEGGDPTVIAVLTITALGLLNGIEVGEWIAAKQALDEIDQSKDE